MKENTIEMYKYQKCIHYVPGNFFDNSKRIKHYCAPNAKTLGEQWEQKQEIDVSACENCENYKCKYIEYPFIIDSLDIKDPKPWNISFEPVRVRLCEDNKTYFGILLGEFPWHTTASFSEEERKLKISTITNSCILLPVQKKIVFGCESWWQRIEPGETIADISDADIGNTWYVKLLNDLVKENAQPTKKADLENQGDM